MATPKGRPAAVIGHPIRIAVIPARRYALCLVYVQHGSHRPVGANPRNMMGAKEELLQNLSRLDASGGIQRIHRALTDAGFRYKGPSNSQTLLYYFRSGGHEIGVAAIRGSPSLLSFPATFWRGRSGLAAALGRASSFSMEPEGFVSSSQYSAGQLRITTSSIETLLSIVDEIIIPEARAAGA